MAARLVRVLGCAWLLVVLALFLFTHPPGWPAAVRDLLLAAAASVGVPADAGTPALAGVAAVARASLVFLAVSAGCWRLGSGLVRFLRLRRSAGEGWAVSMLAGWITAGLGLFGLGVCGLLRPWVLGAAMLWGAWCALRGGAGPVRAAWAGILPRGRGTEERVARLIAWVVAGSLGLVAALALAPETGIDGLTHHLPVAARALALGRLVPMPQNFLFHVPAASELLRAWAMSAGGEPAGRLFGPAAVLLGVVLLAGALRGSPDAGRGRPGGAAGAFWAWAAAAVFVTNPGIISLAASSKPDILLVPLGLAACLLPGRGAAGLAAAGFLLGGALAMKSVAGEFGAALCLGLLMSRGRRAVRDLAVVAAAGAVPFLPWLAWSWLLTGNPVYPAAFGIFEGLGMDRRIARTIMAYLAGVAHVHPYATFAERLAAPWSLTFDEGAAPLLLGLLPLALISSPANPRWGAPRAVLGFFLMIWAAGPVQARYLAPGFALAVLLGVRAMAGGKARWPRLLAGAAVVLQLIDLPHVATFPRALPAGLGLEAPDAYFRRSLPEWAEALGALRALPVGARLLVVGSDEAYPAPRPLLVASRFEPFQAFPLVHASSSPAVLGRRMRQLAVTHVLYNPVAAVFLSRLRAVTPWEERDVALWAAVWRSRAREVGRTPWISRRRGFFVLYALDGSGPGGEGGASRAYLPGAEGVFAQAELEILLGRRGAVEARLRRLERVLGGTGAFEHFVARLRRVDRPREALDRLERAEASGYWDPALWEDEAAAADRLGNGAAADRARARLERLVRPE